MIEGLIFVAALAVLGIIWNCFIAPRLWMRKHGDGIYNARLRFNKKHLNIQKEA